MKVAIVGSRDWPLPQEVIGVVAALPEGTIVVSGGAVGVDTVAAYTAKRRGLEVVEHIPDWKGDGKAAGFIRNQLIVDDADRMVAFQFNGSKGTQDSIRRALKKGIPVRVAELRLEWSGPLQEGI